MYLKYLGSVGLSVLTLFICTAAHPETDQWTALGPDGGEATAILVSPTQARTVYVGTSGGGVFISKDSGDSWRSISNGLLASRISALALNEGVLYAGTYQGVFRLDAGSVRWTDISNGLPSNQVIGDIAVDPNAPLTLYATVTRGLISGSWAVYRSIDGGTTWENMTDSLLLSHSIALIETDPPTLLATSFRGIYRSQDRGEHWQLATAGLPESPSFSDLIVDPTATTTLYAAARQVTESTALPYRSLDGGITWSQIGEGLEQSVFFITDGRIAIDPRQPSRWYWGDSRGVFTRSGTGDAWQPANGSPADRSILSLAVDPESGTVFGGAARSTPDAPTGVLRSRTGGNDWDVLSAGLHASSVITVSPDPETAGRIVVQTRSMGLLMSDDGDDVGGGALEWRPAMIGIEEIYVGALTRALKSPSTLYAVAGDSRFLLNRLYRSIDSGDSWQLLSTPSGDHLSSIVQDPHHLDNLYLVSGSAILQSFDGGQQWQSFNVGICGGQLSLAPPALDGSLLIGCVRDSGLPVSPPIFISLLARSGDGGASWQETLAGPSDSLTANWSFFRDPSSPGTYYAALASFFGGNTFRSESSGASWTEIEGLSRKAVNTILIDPGLPQEILAGTSSEGVLLSKDRGATWTPYNDGLSTANVRHLALDPRVPNRVWAGSTDGVQVVDRGESGSCESSAHSLCLMQRFRVEVEWTDFQNQSGLGYGTLLGPNGGTFWFFDEGNTELAVKVLDGRDINGHFWVFYGALSTVNYTLTFTDTITGQRRIFQNPSGNLSSGGDTRAFPDSLSAPVSPKSMSSIQLTASDSSTIPKADLGAINGEPNSPEKLADSLLLRDRFHIEVRWQTPQGENGTATGVPTSSESGIFWFFQPDNPELFVKMLDGRAINGHHWLFFGSLSNVGFELTVLDLETRAIRTYNNPQGTQASQIDLGTF